MASETRFNHPASHLSSSGPRCRFPASCAQCLQLAPATYLASHPSAYAPIWPTRQPFIHPPIHASIHSSTTPLVDPATHPAAILYATFRALTHPSTHPCLHPSVIHPFIRSSTLTPVHPCIHPDIHPSINQCIHSSESLASMHNRPRRNARSDNNYQQKSCKDLPTHRSKRRGAAQATTAIAQTIY